MYCSCMASRKTVWQQLVARQAPATPPATIRSSFSSALRSAFSTATGSPKRSHNDTVNTGSAKVSLNATEVQQWPPPRRLSTTSSQNGSVSADGPKVICSGIQPTGVPHLGNYLGALREWKRLQDTEPPETKLIFFIADLHALTVPRPREELSEARMQLLAALLAVGLRPDRCTIFFQSSVPAHAELQWILSCTASTGYLSRMTQWKSKLSLGNDVSLDDARARKTLKHGLFSYPVLQAADILVHRATHVPVGEDQRQHLEFTRECATNFRHTYGSDALVAPETLIAPSPRVMSLTNPTAKMSKSDPSPKSRILIIDSEATIQQKIRQALTDSLSDSVSYDRPARPGVSNLIDILAAFDPRGRDPAQLAREDLDGVKIPELKRRVTEALVAELGGIRDRYLDLSARPAYLADVAARGAREAAERAAETMARVKRDVGLS